MNTLQSVNAHSTKKIRWQGERKMGFGVFTWAREGLQWFECGRGGCHGLHSRAGDATEEVAVAAVQPNATERTELGGAIQEA